MEETRLQRRTLKKQDNNGATWLKQDKDGVTWKKPDTNGATWLKQNKDGTTWKKKGNNGAKCSQCQPQMHFNRLRDAISDTDAF